MNNEKLIQGEKNCLENITVFLLQNYFAIYSFLQYNLGIEFCSASVAFTIVF